MKPDTATVDQLVTTGYLAHGLLAWKVAGPRGTVTYLLGGNMLLFDPTWSHSEVIVDSRAVEVQAHAILSRDTRVTNLLTEHYQTMPAGPPDWPLTADDWNKLDLLDLVAAFDRCRWYPKLVDESTGGWCVMPVDQPPASGYPAVGWFMAEETARTVAREHNAFLPEHTIGEQQ